MWGKIFYANQSIRGSKYKLTALVENGQLSFLDVMC